MDGFTEGHAQYTLAFDVVFAGNEVKKGCCCLASTPDATLRSEGNPFQMESFTMVISEIDEEVADYDWFAVDKEGRVGHFTTGGVGTLPRTVAASSDDLHVITEFFRNTLPSSTEARLAPNAQAAANSMDSEAAVGRRFQDFVQMASRGLYSFDHAYALDCPNHRTRPCPLYYRIAIPSNPLHVIDLPMKVQTILNRNVLVGTAFSHDDEVRVE